MQLNTGGRPLGNNIAYYLKGDELVVTELKLVLNVNVPATAVDAEQTFFAKAATDLKQAVPTSTIKLGRAPFDLDVQHWRVSLQREDWQGGIRGRYEPMLTIEVSGEHVPADACAHAAAT